jgi:hypothetical protein
MVKLHAMLGASSFDFSKNDTGGKSGIFIDSCP